MVRISYAQIEKDSLDLSKISYNGKLLNNNFDKQLNTYNFSTQLKYNYGIGGLFLGVKELFVSTITKSATKNIKDEQYLRLYGLYDLSQYLKIGMFTNITS